MDIKEYFSKVNNQSQQVFTKTIQNHSDQIGKVHYLSTCIFEFSELISDYEERTLLATSSSQIESAIYAVCLGLYRQAFSSLRLAMEMALGTVYFSLYKLEHKEWQNNLGDIKWSRIIDPDNGALSARVSNAYFPDISKNMSQYNSLAKNVYRKLSEYVHGNNSTWQSGLQIKKKTPIIKDFFGHAEKVHDIISFTLACRYLKSFEVEKLENLEFLSSQFNYIEPIKEVFESKKL